MATRTESETFDTEALARLVRETPDDELKAGLRANREPLLEEIFRRFPERLSESGKREDLSIEWRIRRDDGEPDRWFVVVEDGRCVAGREIETEPRLVIEVGTLGFVKLVTGTANPIQMFMTGKIKVRGDLVLAARLQSLFTIPTS